MKLANESECATTKLGLYTQVLTKHLKIFVLCLYMLWTISRTWRDDMRRGTRSTGELQSLLHDTNFLISTERPLFRHYELSRQRHCCNWICAAAPRPLIKLDVCSELAGLFLTTDLSVSRWRIVANPHSKLHAFVIQCSDFPLTGTAACYELSRVNGSSPAEYLRPGIPTAGDHTFPRVHISDHCP